MTEHVPLPPFAATSGMTPGASLRMLLIGEAWGEAEAGCRRPFVGSSGKELFLMLGEAMPDVFPELHAEARKLFHFGGGAWVQRREAWLRAAGIGMTNVLALRPPDNKLENLSVAKTALPDKGKNYVHGPISTGNYLRPEFLPEVDRLVSEISATSPNLILALGNTACWAVLGTTGIGGIRGTVSTSQKPRGLKTLASYHPAGVMRNWAWRPIVVADLMKAWRESASPVIIRPSRSILINPTIDEVEAWTSQTISASPALLSVDIETSKGMITCIGFARSSTEAMVIPFDSHSATGNGSYWCGRAEEERAWLAVSRLLASTLPKVFQNGMYDLQYLLRVGLKVANCAEDTMLLHHSIFPELQKGLGFLGSIYTSEPAWKLMRKHRSDEVGVKADE